MRIDATHRKWLFASLGIAGVATAVYIPYALTSEHGPRGSSAIGLTFGITGSAFMLFASLLGVRNRVPVWRLGRAQTWMRGHLWLGTLSFPLILFHAGFAWKGQLAVVLMLLLLAVWISGIAGAAIQHYVPRMLTARVPLETIYEEIPHVRRQLRGEADQLVASICGPLFDSSQPVEMFDANDAAPESETIAVATLVEIQPEDRIRFRSVYLGAIRPFLENPDSPGVEFSNSLRSKAVFDSLRRMLPSAVHPVLDDLENICEEERQLTRQRKLYHFLHGWLLIHVPLSIALLVLGGIHAIVALQY